jgi:acyl-CoA thioesterase
MGDTRFARQMQLDADGSAPGRYHVDVSDAWNCPIVPHGGIVTSVAVRAMELELGHADQRLRSVTSVFAAAVRPGPVVVDVTVLRRGRSISQLSAALRNEGETAGLTAVAVFGASRPGFEFIDALRPDVPSPEECPSFRDSVPDDVPFRFNFWEHADSRVAVGNNRYGDFPPSPSSERVYWYRFEEPPMLDGGVLDPLALVTFCDTMPGAVAQRMGSDTPIWLPPSADLTVHLLGEVRSEWVLARNRCRRAADGYASLEMELWDPAGGLAAYGTQVAFFTFPEGPPDPERLRPPA